MNTTNKRQYLKDYQKPDYAIDSCLLYFKLHPSKTIVHATLHFTRNNFSNLNKASLVLNGEKIKLLKLELNNDILNSDQYEITDKELIIKNVPEKFILKTTVEINPEDNKSCEGLYLSQGIYCTQCEAESFRKITYFLDRPDVMTLYTVEIEADEEKFPLLLSNGDCIEKKSLPGGLHYAKWTDPFKKPSYLFALVAGDMGCVTDHFTTMSGRDVKLEVFAPHGKQDRSLHAMKSLKESMLWDEVTYGLEYDLNQYMIVSIDDFNMGAMENKGLNVFNSKLVLADEQTATDNDFHNIQSVVGHEYFHNWSGNRVTCRNWFELSLKEGLTVFRDQEFSGDMTNAVVQRIRDVDALRSRQFSEDDSPNAHAVRPESCLAVDNFYTATIYEKGAEIIRMLQTLISRAGFKKGLALYFKRHDGQAVTIDDFIQAMTDSNNIDLSEFKLWYSQAGTPVVTVTENYDLLKKIYTLKLNQTCPLTQSEKTNESFHKKPFYIPLNFGLMTPLGQEIKTENHLLILDSANKIWTFNNILEKPILSLNRNFSAPVKINHDLSYENILSLIKFDTDPFNRREYASKMLLSEIKKLINCFQKNEPLIPNSDIISALGVILNDSQLDPHVKSLMLNLPSDRILIQSEDLLDPKAFSAARISLATSFVDHYSSDILDLYTYHHKLNSIGDRALKNELLHYMTVSKFKNIDLILKNQYLESKNMTDIINALSNLASYESDFSLIAIEDFYTKWSNDSVVFNKLLQVIASATGFKNTFQRVLELTNKKAFDKNNPNNLYALHRVFGDNFLHFHEKSGQPYTWFADEIIRIDQFNPQVAARLANCFSLTKKLGSDLKIKSISEINRILSFSKLSENTKEILEKYITD